MLVHTPGSTVPIPAPTPLLFGQVSAGIALVLTRTLSVFHTHPILYTCIRSCSPLLFFLPLRVSKRMNVHVCACAHACLLCHVLQSPLQQRLAEREEILAYENHLSQACKGQPVSEATSLLLNSVAHRDEHGPARRPPKEILDRLQSSCRRLKLGNRLCRSRDPDFLLDIINIQVC